MITLSWSFSIECWNSIVAHCVNYCSLSKTLSQWTFIYFTSITCKSFFKIIGPSKDETFPYLRCFLKRAKRETLPEIMFLCNIFPLLHFSPKQSDDWLNFQQSWRPTVDTFHKQILTSIREPAIMSWNTKIAFMGSQSDGICYVASRPFLGEMFALNIRPNNSNFC